MSTHWGFHCFDCDDSSARNFNHGEDVLRSMLASITHIVAAERADFLGWLMPIQFMGDDGNEVLRWLKGHYKHNLCLENEYGDLKQIDEDIVSKAKRNQ